MRIYVLFEGGIPQLNHTYYSGTSPCSPHMSLDHCSLSYSALQSQKAVSAWFTSNQILHGSIGTCPTINSPICSAPITLPIISIILENTRAITLYHVYARPPNYIPWCSFADCTYFGVSQNQANDRPGQSWLISGIFYLIYWWRKRWCNITGTILCLTLSARGPSLDSDV